MSFAIMHAVKCDLVWCHIAKQSVMLQCWIKRKFKIFGMNMTFISSCEVKNCIVHFTRWNKCHTRHKRNVQLFSSRDEINVVFIWKNGIFSKYYSCHLKIKEFFIIFFGLLQKILTWSSISKSVTLAWVLLDVVCNLMLKLFHGSSPNALLVTWQKARDNSCRPILNSPRPVCSGFCYFISMVCEKSNSIINIRICPQYVGFAWHFRPEFFY